MQLYSFGFKLADKKINKNIVDIPNRVAKHVKIIRID